MPERVATGLPEATPDESGHMVASASSAPSGPRLVYDESFDSVDSNLTSALRVQTTSTLSECRERYLAVFENLLQEPHDGSAMSFATQQLATLAHYLASWPTDLTRDIHAAMHAATEKAWGDGGSDGDNLALFFSVYVNASNYDAIILESIIAVATSTFDAALDRAHTAFPTLTADEVQELRKIWDVPRWTMQSVWQDLHRERFHAAFRTWGHHQADDAMIGVINEMFRSHFEVQALEAVRSYRWAMLPFVTLQLSQRDMASAAAQLDAETRKTLMQNAFDDFPVPREHLDRVSQLTNAYMFAWYDTWSKGEDLKERAIAQGREEYADELQLLDMDDQFARYGRVAINKSWQALFDEVRGFFVPLMLTA